MLTKPDFFNQAFINFASTLDAPVLDIGAAYGVATLPALQKGAHVIANDLDERHLALLKSEVAAPDLPRLELRVGRMPEDLGFPEESLGAVLASRVLNFIHPTKLEESFYLIYKWLRKGGKFFYLGGTPYMGTYSQFLPHYECHKKEGRPWPGFIDNIKAYVPPPRSHDLPLFINLLDEELIRELMGKAGFEIEVLSYIPAEEEHPKDMKLDGREHLGAIGLKG